MNENGKVRYLASIICLLCIILVVVLYFKISENTDLTVLQSLLKDLVPELIGTLIILPVIFFFFERVGINLSNSAPTTNPPGINNRIKQLEDERNFLESLSSEVLRIRESEGLTLANNTFGKTLQKDKPDIFCQMETKIESLRSVLQMSEGSNLDKEKLKAQITLGLGYMAKGQWELAIEIFDRYIDKNIQEWEWHLYRASAHANSRLGKKNDLAALMGTSDAIALAGDKIDNKMRAMLFSYRAAMLKRLGRLKEANNDLVFALELSTNTDEHVLADIYYNYACIYGISGNIKSVLKYINLIKKLKDQEIQLSYLTKIKEHFDTYFKKLKTNRSFVLELKHTKNV